MPILSILELEVSRQPCPKKTNFMSGAKVYLVIFTHLVESRVLMNSTLETFRYLEDLQAMSLLSLASSTLGVITSTANMA